MKSNLPPGVSENMIPGNRPEDVADEQFETALLNKITEAGIKLPVESDELWAVVYLARDLGYVNGFNEGKLEAEMAEAADHLEDDS